MTAGILVLSFAASTGGRQRAEEIVDVVLQQHDLGRITGGGQDLVTGGFDLEIATHDAESLLARLESVLESQKGLTLEEAVLIER